MCSYLKSYSYPGQKRNSETFSSISSLVTKARVAGTLRWGCRGWVQEAVEGAVPLKVQEKRYSFYFCAKMLKTVLPCPFLFYFLSSLFLGRSIVLNKTSRLRFLYREYRFRTIVTQKVYGYQ